MSSLRSRLRTPIRRVAHEFLRRIGREQKPPIFTTDMTIDEAWHAHSDAPGVFARHHLPSCDGCAVRFDESLQEATEAYGIDLADFLKELNSLPNRR
jgi:hybrid cluster-associated redox disulfide protein